MTKSIKNKRHAFPSGLVDAVEKTDGNGKHSVDEFKQLLIAGVNTKELRRYAERFLQEHDSTAVSSCGQLNYAGREYMGSILPKRKARAWKLITAFSGEPFYWEGYVDNGKILEFAGTERGNE